MRELTFVRENESTWQRLYYLVQKADLSVKRLSAAEMADLVRLYREVSHHLAIVDTQGANPEMADFLNALVVKAYGILYEAPRRTARDVLRLILSAPAQAIRKHVNAMFLSLGLVVTSIVFTVLVMATRPDLEGLLIDRSDPNVQGWIRGEFPERDASEAVMMWAFYGSNNPRVSLLIASLAAGTFGVGSAALTFMNGQMIGALGYVMADEGKLGHLLVSIFPHGASELTGMVIACGAGFVMAGAMIAPGRRRRGAALKAVGRDALTLTLLAVAMMFAAAPVEAFLSFNPNVPNGVKFAFGLIALSAWIAYFGWYGRPKQTPDGERPIGAKTSSPIASSS